MKELLEFLPKMRGKKIGVFGDLIADEYVYGTIHRFSREAPVFIVNYEDAQIALGGAANAINNIHELGGIPYAFGILGNDPAGRSLLSNLQEKGIPCEGLLVQDKYATFVKQRVVAGSPHSVKQQILRIDRCIAIPTDADVHQLMEKRLLSMLDQIDALIISDYDLGVASPARVGVLLEELRKKRIPCYVDSRRNLASYSGVTAATPNEPEVESIIGKSLERDEMLLCQSGRELQQRLQAEALLVTRGKSGMALFLKDEDPRMIPIFGSTDIVDVTGAGDTVISTFALANTAGASYYDAARLANCAAGLVVMKRGAATVTPEELSEAINVSELSL